MKGFATAVFGTTMCIGVGGLCVAWAVVSLGRGELLTAITALGFAVMLLGLLTFFLRVRWGKLTAKATIDATATTIRPDRVSDLSIRLSLLGGVFAMALFAVLQPFGKLDIPVPHTLRYYVPVMSAVGAAAGAPVLLRAIRRGSMSYLRLSAEGFEFAQGRLPTRGQWADVEDVSYRPPEGPEPAANSIVVVMRDGTTPTLAVGSYTRDGRALRKMVRFYWKHPENRGELTDGRALERLRNEDFGRRPRP